MGRAVKTNILHMTKNDIFSIYSSCITIAGGFVAFCLGYTSGYEDIDIFCTRSALLSEHSVLLSRHYRSAFAKLTQKIGEIDQGIRLVRSAIVSVIVFTRLLLVCLGNLLRRTTTTTANRSSQCIMYTFREH